MKIVCLLGSPREKGNSATIANRFCTTAEKLGARVQTFVLNNLQYRGCQGCMVCKTKLDRCVLEDYLTEVLDAVHETDVLVLASPVYYGDVSSQLKAFIDRTFSYLLPDYITNPNPSRLSPGKKLVFILTQGNPDEDRFADIFERYDYFFKWYGFNESHLIRACGVREPGEVAAHEDVMKLAEATAEKICGKLCPECDHVFKGKGFEGIDAHWRSKHEEELGKTYEEVWQSIKDGTYQRSGISS